MTLVNENDWKNLQIHPFYTKDNNVALLSENKEKNVNKKNKLRGHTFDLGVLFTGFQTLHHDRVFQPFNLFVQISCIGNLYLRSALMFQFRNIGSMNDAAKRYLLVDLSIQSMHL